MLVKHTLLTTKAGAPSKKGWLPAGHAPRPASVTSASIRVESQRADRVQDKISATSVKDFLSKGEDSHPASEKGCLMGTPP